jgi:hypothetical protein
MLVIFPPKYHVHNIAYCIYNVNRLDFRYGDPMSLLEIGPFSGTLVILDHSAALYRYSPALERYRMWDSRFDDITTCFDLHAFVSVFNENFEKALQSAQPIITMPYTPLMAKVLETCLHKYYSGFLDNWLCTAFFHNDEDTAKIPLASGENPLEYKSVLLKTLDDFPYIKKITIPYNLLITYPSLYNLIESIL